MKNTKTFKTGEVVECLWLDAYSVDDWTHVDEVHDTELVPARSVGIFVRQTSSSIILALTYDSTNDNYSSFIIIPKGMIQKVRLLK
jgi:hypothetical protein